MAEFFNVLPPSEALRLIVEQLQTSRSQDLVPTVDACQRITRQAIYSPEDLPSFPRSSMDGYAVRSKDTFGASESLPAYLDIIGDTPAGLSPVVTLGPGQTTTAYTGGPLPGQADAVVMVELTQRAGDSTIEIMRPVAPGENVVQVGEDINHGDLILPAGHLVRPQDIGGLLALGITQLPVSPQPRIGIISSGDELVPPDFVPGPAQVRDLNTYTLSSLSAECGAIPFPVGLVSDDYGLQLDMAKKALSISDIVLFSAGSSVSSHDMTVNVISELGEPGVLFHGISFKPGKPTIGAIINGKPVFGLPGNPVSAMIVFNLLVKPVIYSMVGLDNPPVKPSVVAHITRDIPSQSGREDYIPVRLISENDTLSADPIWGKSNLIYTLVRADGLIKIPLDAGGLYAGSQVSVSLF